MGSSRDILQKMARAFNRATDWLLIILGAALIAKAVLAVDVPAAMYVICGFGALLAGAGLWSRSRRKRREREG